MLTPCKIKYINDNLTSHDNLDVLNFEDLCLSNFIDSTQVGGNLILRTPEISEKANKRWNATQKIIKFCLTNAEMNNFFDANENIDLLFAKIFTEYIEPIPANNMVQYVIDHDTFDQPISSCYMKRNDMTASMLQREFDTVFQSRKKIPENAFQDNHELKLIINVLPSRLITGGSNDKAPRKRGRPSLNKQPQKRICREKREIINMNDYIEKSRFIHVINADNFCLVRAILIGQAFADKETNSYTLIRKNNRELNKRVLEIRQKFLLPDEPLNLTHVKLLKEYLKNYEITVYDSIDNGSSILYPSESQRNENFSPKLQKFINIVLENNHFNVITKNDCLSGL